MERQRLDWRRDVTLAWHTAMLAQTAMFAEGGLKPLAHYLGDEVPRKTAAQQKLELDAFADMWGLQVRPANRAIKVIYPKGHPKHQAA